MIKLIHGDCLEEMKKIEDGSIDLVLTDPPYGMDYQSARRTDKSQWKPKIANDKLPFVWFLHEASKKLKDGGALIAFCRFDSWNDFSRACELSGLEVKAEIVWDKMNHGTGDLKGCPGFRHEIAVFAVKGRFTFYGKRPQSLIAVPRVNPVVMVQYLMNTSIKIEMLCTHQTQTCPRYVETQYSSLIDTEYVRHLDTLGSLLVPSVLGGIKLRR